jgi:hypothetical protein
VNLPHARGVGVLRLAVLTAAVSLALAALGFGSAIAQETVTLRGTVIDGTAGAELPPEVPVLLLISDAVGSLVFTGQALTEPDGGFQFDDVPRADGGIYALSVDYEGVFYDNSLSFQDVLDEVQLTVYETTQDASVVSVTRQVLVIAEVNKKDREISAIEFVGLNNSSDRTLLPTLANPEQLSFLRFALPLEAAELNVRSNLPGGDIVSIGTGFALTSAVLPGEHNLEFSFRFPYTGDSVSYRQSLPQGADVYQVLVPQRLALVEVRPLRPIPSIGIEGSEFRAWEERGFERGQGIVLELTNLPQPGLASRLQKSITDGTFWEVAIPGVVAVTLALLLLFGAFRAPWRAVSLVGTSNDELDRDLAQREALVREVAALDEEFQRGNVAELEYHQQREALITRIRRSAGSVHEGDESLT